MKLSNFLTSMKKLLFIFLIPIFGFAYSPIIVSFSTQKETLYSGTITINMVNYSTEDVKLLKWNTPLEETLSANVFNVTIDGKNVQYMGRMVKRGAPTESDYLLFQAGEVKNITLKLPKYYEMNKEGSYTVTYAGVLKYKKAIKRKVKTIKMLKSTVATIDFLYKPSQKKRVYSQKLPANFNGCSQAEINSINLAHDEAISMATNAYDVMISAPINTTGERYSTWFGAANSTRQSKITTHFNNFSTALDQATIQFDCTCTDDYFAYVYPSQHYIIYLCNAFWSANTAGTDSKAGTIIHEMSHFTVMAGTDDHVYGQAGSKSLATSNPEQAIDNADSHEYFAENTPYLSMDTLFDSAITINLSTDLPLISSIDAIGAKDVFTFIAAETKKYTLFTSGSLDTIGALYDSQFAQLVSNDDISNDHYNFQLSYTLQAGHRYYLVVQEYAYGVGSYTLESTEASKPISAFVERFYVEILGRPSDSAGLNSWVSLLADGVRAAEDIAKGFIFSSEYDIESKSDNVYLDTLYKAFFNRTPDEGGMSEWLRQISEGLSREKVLDGFLGSQEFKNLADEYGIKVELSNIEQFVSRFYEQCLLRVPDSAGLNDWASQLASGSRSGADIAKGFVGSQEFINRNLNNSDYLHVLYRAFFAREADAAGFNGWKTQLDAGVSKESVLEGFLGAQEFANLANSYGIRVR